MAADIYSPRAGRRRQIPGGVAEQSAQASERSCLTKQGGRHLHVHPHTHKRRDGEGEISKIALNIWCLTLIQEAMGAILSIQRKKAVKKDRLTPGAN